MVDIPERTESHGPVFIYGVEGEQIEEENDAYNDLRYDIGLHKDYEADEAAELMPSCFPLLIFDCVFMKLKNCFMPNNKDEKEWFRSSLFVGGASFPDKFLTMPTSVRAFGRAAAAWPLSKRSFAPSVRLFCAGGKPETPSGGFELPKTPLPIVEKFGREALQKAQDAAQTAAQSISEVANSATGAPISQTLQKAQEAAQTAAQSIGEVANSATGSPISQTLQKAQEAAQTAAQNIGEAANSATGSPVSQTLQKAQEAAQTAAQSIGEVANSATGSPILQKVQGVAQANGNQVTQQLAPLLTTLLILARTSPGQPLTEEQQAKIAQVFPSNAQEMLQNLNDAVPEDPHVAQLRRIADALAVIEAHLTQATPSEPVAPAASAARFTPGSSE